MLAVWNCILFGRSLLLAEDHEEKYLSEQGKNMKL